MLLPHFFPSHPVQAAVVQHDPHAGKLSTRSPYRQPSPSADILSILQELNGPPTVKTVAAELTRRRRDFSPDVAERLARRAITAKLAGII